MRLTALGLKVMDRKDAIVKDATDRCGSEGRRLQFYSASNWKSTFHHCMYNV